MFRVAGVEVGDVRKGQPEAEAGERPRSCRKRSRCCCPSTIQAMRGLSVPLIQNY